MNMEVTPLEDRLRIERKKAAEKYKFHRESQKQIDFISENGWLNERDVKVKCELNTSFSKYLTVHISNVPVEEFIDNILGPFHREFDVRWKLKLKGSENSPVFMFSSVGSPTSVEFRVKEGEFTVCKFVSEHKGYTSGFAPEPITELRMICE